VGDGPRRGDPGPPAAIPRPGLTLRVGITGHRLDKLPEEDLAGLREHLRDVLASLEAGLLRFQARSGGRLYSREAPRCRLVSALAEGADRLAVEAAPRGWTLAALLPMPHDIYRQDFLAEGELSSASANAFEALLARAETVTELPLAGPPEAGAPRDAQYAALGRALVREIDCLVAVWDGRPPKGPGGTAAVVADAMDLGLAVLWLDPSGQAPARQLARFAGGDISRPVCSAIDDAALDEMLAGLLGFEGARGQLPSILAGPWPKPGRWGFAYRALHRLAGAGKPKGRPRVSRGWPPEDPLLRTLEAELPQSAAAIADQRGVLSPRSFWADTLAWSHAQLYRSAYVGAFLLAGLSVPIGLLALFGDTTQSALGLKAIAVAVELAVVLFVAWIVVRGRRRHWHAAWIEARELSELLRAIRPVQMIGRASDLLDPTPLHSRPKEAFAAWYARATLREIRPAAGLLDSGHLTRVLAATREHLLAGQIAYHRANARALARIDSFLHRWGDRCFLATIAVLIAYLILYSLEALLLPDALKVPLKSGVKPFVTFMAASLPALGAAFAGIRAQGEFANRVQQSERTLAELTAIEAEIDEVLATPAQRVLPEHAAGLLVTAAQVMMDDVRHWRHVYVGKTLALPA
jgi:hypothetical protein